MKNMRKSNYNSYFAFFQSVTPNLVQILPIHFFFSLISDGIGQEIKLTSTNFVAMLPF